MQAVIAYFNQNGGSIPVCTGLVRARVLLVCDNATSQSKISDMLTTLYTDSKKKHIYFRHHPNRYRAPIVNRFTFFGQRFGTTVSHPTTLTSCRTNYITPKLLDWRKTMKRAG